MKKDKIFFSDLDGTLLYDEYNFSDLTKKSVKKLYDLGYYLIPVTARPLIDLKEKAKQLGIDKKGIIAASNGSQIYDFDKKEFIFNKFLDKKIIDKLFDRYYNKFNEKLVLYTPDKIYSFGESKNTIEWSKILGAESIVINNKDDVPDDITHFVVIFSKKSSHEYREKEFTFLMEEYSDFMIEQFTNRIINISSKNVNKGTAIDIIKKYLNANNATTYAFGDSYNDVEFIKSADVGVCMLNGIDLLKDISDDITFKDNKNDGVVDYIFNKVLVKDGK